jgi:hypothetical protein
MEKIIPIDQLFKNKLSNGQEQLNLGAWANMERILDGKNPYAEQEPKKKRRILPLFLAFLILLSGALTAGYISITKKATSKNDVVAENGHAPVVQNGATETIAMANTTNNIQNTIATNEASVITKSSTSNVTNNDEIVKVKNRINHSSKNQNKNLVQPVNTNTYAVNDNKLSSKIESKNKTYHQENTNAVNKNEIAASNFNNIAEINNADNNTSSLPKVAKKSKKEIKKDTISLIEIKEKTTKNSSSKSIEYDTVGRYSKVVEKLVDVVEEEVIPFAKAKLANPRLVNLSPEEELNATKKIELKSNNEIVVNKQIEASTVTKKETKSIKGSTSDNGYSSSIFNKMKAFSNKMAMKKIEFYPGMSVGVNAAFINTEHNYGGFHFGLNNLIPVSNYFSILSELKLFYKNNSGYSVNDKKTSLFDYNADINTLSAQNQTIHKTTIDSTTRKYNFRSFATIELPLMLQAHIGKATPYIGFNLAYSLKLNTTSISKNYAVKDTVILSNSVAFTQPANTSYEFVREDFGSRFGIGYSIGASYSLNPNLYIDLRLSNVLKDNSKTLSAREISDGIFKVPFVQFSIGYRFKKFIPNN